MNLVNLLNTFRGNLSLELMRFINYTEGLDGHLYNGLLGLVGDVPPFRSSTKMCTDRERIEELKGCHS